MRASKLFLVTIFILILPVMAYADYYSDTNGDGVTDTISVSSSGINVHDGSTGQDRFYTYTGGTFIINSIIDTDGTAGNEIVVIRTVGQTSEDGIHVIHDSSGQTSKYLYTDGTFLINSIIDTDGTAGNEIVVIRTVGQTSEDGIHVIHDSSGQTSKYLYSGDYGTTGAFFINNIADTNGTAGNEIVVIRTVGQTLEDGIHVIHDSSGQTSKYLYSGDYGTTGAFFINNIADTDGTAGNEIVVIRAVGQTLEDGIHVIHDSSGQTSKYLYSGDYGTTGAFFINNIADTDGTAGKEIVVIRDVGQALEDGIHVIHDSSGQTSKYLYTDGTFVINNITDTDGAAGNEIVVIRDVGQTLEDGIHVIHDSTMQTSKYLISTDYQIQAETQLDGNVGAEICYYWYTTGSNGYQRIIDRVEITADASDCNTMEGITVTPIGSVNLGSVAHIQWHYYGNPGNYVKLELLKNDSLYQVITSSVPIGTNGTGNYNWNVPGNIPLASDYKLRISTIGSGSKGYLDISNMFSIVDTIPPVTSASPGGGSYNGAQSVTLSCNDSGGSGCDTTYYCLGVNCTPTTVYSGAISVTPTNYLKFYSTDIARNSGGVAIETYTQIYALTMNITGSGLGNVVSLPQGIDCGDGTQDDCTQDYDDGTNIQLTATPDSNSVFAGWSGVGCTGMTNPCGFTINSASPVYAAFSSGYTITAAVNNGVAGAIAPSGSVEVAEGEDQTFTITPNAGYYIDDLIVDSSSAGAAASYAFTNVTADHSIEAQLYENPAEIESIVNTGDVDGDGIDDIGVLITTQAGGKYVSIKKATSGASIRNVYFGNTYIANAVAVIPDQNGNSTRELAFLGKNKTSGAMVAQVVDTDSTFIRNVYYDSSYDLREFLPIPDTNGNGKNDVVYLGVHNTNGQLVAQVRDAYTGDYIRGIWYDMNYDAKGMAFSNTISGNTPELSVFGVHMVNGTTLSQIYNAASASFIRNVWFDKNYTPQTNGYVSLSDVDGEGTYELSTLGIYNGSMISQIKNATSGFVRNVFYDSSYSPVDLAVMPNIANAASYPNSEELALLEQKTGSVQVQVKDAVSGSYINNISIDSNYTPLGIISVSDQNGDGAADFAVLGRHTVTGARKVFVKNALTGSTIISIDFPKY